MSHAKEFFDALLVAKEQDISALLAFTMACLRGRYQDRKGIKILIDAVMCAMIAWFIRDILDIMGLSKDLAYIASIFIGYVGIDFIGLGIKRHLAKYIGNDDKR